MRAYASPSFPLADVMMIMTEHGRPRCSRPIGAPRANVRLLGTVSRPPGFAPARWNGRTEDCCQDVTRSCFRLSSPRLFPEGVRFPVAVAVGVGVPSSFQSRRQRRRRRRQTRAPLKSAFLILPAAPNKPLAVRSERHCIEGRGAARGRGRGLHRWRERTGSRRSPMGKGRAGMGFEAGRLWNISCNFRAPTSSVVQ